MPYVPWPGSQDPVPGERHGFAPPGRRLRRRESDALITGGGTTGGGDPSEDRPSGGRRGSLPGAAGPLVAVHRGSQVRRFGEGGHLLGAEPPDDAGAHARPGVRARSRRHRCAVCGRQRGQRRPEHRAPSRQFVLVFDEGGASWRATHDLRDRQGSRDRLLPNRPGLPPARRSRSSPLRALDRHHVLAGGPGRFQAVGKRPVPGQARRPDYCRPQLPMVPGTEIAGERETRAWPRSEPVGRDRPCTTGRQVPLVMAAGMPRPGRERHDLSL